MNVAQLIRTWYDIADGQSPGNPDMFFRFISIWVAANALYASRHSNERSDAKQILRFASDPDVVDRHRQLLDSDESYKAALAVIKERGVSDPRGGRKRTIQDERNVLEVLQSVYQVRCNLFHGGKLPGNVRDERLVDAAYAVTSLLISPLIPPASG